MVWDIVWFVVFCLLLVANGFMAYISFREKERAFTHLSIFFYNLCIVIFYWLADLSTQCESLFIAFLFMFLLYNVVNIVYKIWNEK